MTEAVQERPSDLLFKEYGRHVKQMIDHLRTVEDKEQQSRMARTIIEVMRIVNPVPGSETEEYYQKLWDHLHIMSEFTLDITAPFEKPEPKDPYARPTPLKPATEGLKLRNYGKNFELLLEKVLKTEDPEDRRAGEIFLGRLIKNFYAGYNREIMDDVSVVRTLREVSNGKIDFKLEEVEAEGLFVQRNAPQVHNFQREQQGGRPNNTNNRRQHGGGGGNQKRRRY